MKKSNSKQMGAGGGVFWKRAAAVLCAIQVTCVALSNVEFSSLYELLSTIFGGNA